MAAVDVAMDALADSIFASAASTARSSLKLLTQPNVDLFLRYRFLPCKLLSSPIATIRQRQLCLRIGLFCPGLFEKRLGLAKSCQRFPQAGRGSVQFGLKGSRIDNRQ